MATILVATGSTALATTIVQNVSVNSLGLTPSIITMPSGMSFGETSQSNAPSYSIESFDTSLGILTGVDVRFEITSMNSRMDAQFNNCFGAGCTQNVLAGPVNWVFGIEFDGFPGTGRTPVDGRSPDLWVDSSQSQELSSAIGPSSLSSGISNGEFYADSYSSQQFLDYFSAGSSIDFGAIAAASLNADLTCIGEEKVEITSTACAVDADFLWDWTARVQTTYEYRAYPDGPGDATGGGGGGDNSQIPPVPLPAALPLLLAGIGALGVAARRRKG
jgi:hypothetical protein